MTSSFLHLQHDAWDGFIDRRVDDKPIHQRNPCFTCLCRGETWRPLSNQKKKILLFTLTHEMLCHWLVSSHNSDLGHPWGRSLRLQVSNAWQKVRKRLILMSWKNDPSLRSSLCTTWPTIILQNNYLLLSGECYKITLLVCFRSTARFFLEPLITITKCSLHT